MIPSYVHGFSKDRRLKNDGHQNSENGGRKNRQGVWKGMSASKRASDDC